MTPTLKHIESAIVKVRAELEKLRAQESDRATPLKVRLGNLESAYSEVAHLERQMARCPEVIAEFDARVSVWTSRRNELMERAARGIAQGKSSWETHLAEATRIGGFIAAAPELRREIERQLSEVAQAEIERISTTVLP